MVLEQSLIVIIYFCNAGVILMCKGQVDSVYILFFFFFFVASLRNLSWFKLSQHAQNLDPGERDKQENRMMMIGWGGAISFHVRLNNKENNKYVLVLNNEDIFKSLHHPSATPG